jgi:hypothetical protein
MDIIHRLITHKKAIKTTVWGIRVPEKVKMRWSMLAAIMRVPTNRLILFVLQDWTRQNADILLDNQTRNKLADYITRLYLNKKLS